MAQNDSLDFVFNMYNSLWRNEAFSEGLSGTKSLHLHLEDVVISDAFSECQNNCS